MRYKLLFCLVVAASLLGAIAVNSPAADAPAAVANEVPAPPPKTDIRVYDIRDLILVVHDYPIGQTVVAPTDTPAPPPPDEVRVDELMKLIEDIVATESWRDSGGTIGAIRVFNGQLIITQTPENLKLIETLLTQLRHARSPMVRIRADWVLLRPGQVEELLKNGRDDKSALPEINRETLDKTAGKVVHYVADMSCFSGQTVHLESGRAKSILTTTEREPVAGNKKVVAYDTKRETVQFGLSLQVTPVIGGDSATLDLMSKSGEEQDAPNGLAVTESTGENAAARRILVVTESAGEDAAARRILEFLQSAQKNSVVTTTTQPAQGEQGLATKLLAELEKNAANANNPPDRVNSVVQHFHTTIQVPLNKPVLVAGMTADPSVTQQQGEQWYLIVEADAGTGK